MTQWARRIRGTFKMGLTWAVAGIVVGGVAARVPGWNSDLPLPLLFAPLGFAIGVTSSALIIAAQSRRGFDRISIPRFVAWGAASGGLLAGVFGIGAALRGGNVLGDLLLFGPALIGAGAVCAAGSLALARRADRFQLAAAQPTEPELSQRETLQSLEPGD